MDDWSLPPDNWEAHASVTRYAGSGVASVHLDPFAQPCKPPNPVIFLLDSFSLGFWVFSSSQSFD